jgi:hypothetical protein
VNWKFRGLVSFLWLCKCWRTYRFAIYLKKICQKHCLKGRIVHYLACPKGSGCKLSWPAWWHCLSKKNHVKFQLEQPFYLSSSFNPVCPEHVEGVLISRPRYRPGITMKALLTTGHYEIICLCAPKLIQSFYARSQSYQKRLLASPWLSVCPHLTTRLLPEVYSRNLGFEYF